MNMDLQKQVDRLRSQLNMERDKLQKMDDKVMILENAKSDLERKTNLEIANSKLAETQLDEVRKIHESEMEQMHNELQRVYS